MTRALPIALVLFIFVLFPNIQQQYYFFAFVLCISSLDRLIIAARVMDTTISCLGYLEQKYWLRSFEYLDIVCSL